MKYFAISRAINQSYRLTVSDGQPTAVAVSPSVSILSKRMKPSHCHIKTLSQSQKLKSDAILFANKRPHVRRQRLSKKSTFKMADELR